MRQPPRPTARVNIVKALNEGGFGDTTRVVRINDWTTGGPTATSSTS